MYFRVCATTANSTIAELEVAIKEWLRRSGDPKGNHAFKKILYNFLFLYLLLFFFLH